MIQSTDTEMSREKLPRENSLIEPDIKNPFVHKLKLSCCDKIQLILCFILLVPFRLISVLILLIIFIILGYTMTLGLSKQELEEVPLKGWRKGVCRVLRFLGRALVFCMGFHKIKKNGKRATKEECTIFVAAPHTSFFDIIVFFILGLPIGVSRAENGKLPIVGRVIRGLQPILVTRENSKNKRHTIEEIKKRSDPNSNWKQVLIFPEGTTTNGSCLISFKPGAFIPQLPVQPVVIQFKNRIDTITWTWEGLSAYKAAFLTLCQFNNSMEVSYLPVYTPSEQEKENPVLYADNVRHLMARYLKVATTNHSYEDCRLMCRASELNLPFESAIIEFTKLKDKLGINYENCKELLEKYAAFARKNDGKMSLNEFCKYLNLPPTKSVEFVFSTYDRNRDGTIDFREFLIGLSLLSRPDSSQDNLRLAFEMFQKDDRITLTDLQSILSSAFSMPYDETKSLFEKINVNNNGYITFDQFYKYVSHNSSYAKIFSALKQLKILGNNIELENIANNSNNRVLPFESKISSNGSLTKRPLLDKSKQDANISSADSVEDLADHKTKST